MNGVSGRGISRGVSAIGAPNVQQDDHTRGYAITTAILRLAQAAAPGEAAANTISGTPDDGPGRDRQLR
jgi:hyaluronate lyase